MNSMSGTIRMSFDATTIKEAKERATERWRELVDDETAMLPWDTEFDISLVEVSGTKSVSATVTIELDDIDTVLQVVAT